MPIPPSGLICTIVGFGAMLRCWPYLVEALLGEVTGVMIGTENDPPFDIEFWLPHDRGLAKGDNWSMFKTKTLPDWLFDWEAGTKYSCCCGCPLLVGMPFVY